MTAPELNAPPIPLTPLFGRARQVSEVSDLFASARFVTLTGSGGCGKTRLSIAVADHVRSCWGREVIWADLSRVLSDSGVAHLVAGAVGLQEPPMRGVVDAVAIALRDSDAMLLLDNCEHVIEGASEVIEAILSRCPSMSVLATSRARLGIDGEILYRVPSLFDEDAAALFVDRARSVRSDFALTASDAAEVASVCRRLDGIPLAIELAAAQVRVMTVHEIDEALQERLVLLASASHGRVERQQTLEASVRWSVERLDDAGRMLLGRLSHFVGGFSLAAAEAVSGDDAGTAVQRIAQLVDHSLVEVEQRDGRSRYRLLETIRAHAATNLREDPALELDVRRRHLTHFAGVLEKAESDLAGPEVLDALDRLAPDHENLIAALRSAREFGDLGSVVRIVASEYWILRGGVGEARSAVEWALSQPSLTDQLRARGSLAAARLALDRWDLLAVAHHASSAIDAAEKLGDRLLEANARVTGSTATLWSGDEAASRTILGEALEIATEHGDRAAEAGALGVLGQLSFSRFDIREARDLFQRSIDAARPSGALRVLYESLNYRFLIAFLLGEDVAAAEACAEGLAVSSRTGTALGESLFSSFSAALAVRRGDMGEAQRWLDDARRYADVSGHPIALAQWESHRALAARAKGDLEAAREGFAVMARLASAFSIHAAAVIAAGYGAEVEALAGLHEDARLSVERGREVEAVVGTATGIVSLGAAIAEERRGRLDLAEQQAHRALEESIAFESTPFLIESFDVLASLAAHKPAPDVRPLGAAAAAWRTKGWKRPATFEDRVDAAVAAAREVLSEEEFAKQFAEGESMSLDDAVAYARRGRGRRDRPPSGWASLTPAELGVVDLVAEGATNAQIAERLFVTVATVKSHLTHIYSKLGVSSRTQLLRELTRRA